MALGRSSLFTFVVFLTCLAAARAWDSDLELFDLVEEIPHSFYEFLSVPQDASSVEIKKAYRRLSLSLHPDKNKADDAEIQFRQLVAIYEVLKDEERRQRYDDILVNGLPDWRQPVFYYRRVRKMSNAELGFLVFLILTVGHYAVIWSIYLEKQLDEMLSKKKKEKKKKLVPRPTEDPIGQERDRAQDRPHWQDILPLKLSIWLYLSIKALPQTIQEMKQYYEEYKEMKRKEKEEVEAEQDATPREKRPKVKKPKQEFPVYQPPESLPHTYEQGASIEDVEEQMDDWLEDRKGSKKKNTEWTEEDLSMLSRSMAKFPGGTPGRWEKIAHDLGRSVNEVTTKVKQVKDCVSNTSGLVRLSELKSDVEEDGSLRRRNKKSGVEDPEGRSKGRRQRDFDPSVEEEPEEEKQEGQRNGEEEKLGEEREGKSVWTQNQQKLLEVGLQQYAKGLADRWDRIALLVPGKTKEECMIRYKMLAELVKKRKQAKR